MKHIKVFFNLYNKNTDAIKKLADLPPNKVKFAKKAAKRKMVINKSC